LPALEKAAAQAQRAGKIISRIREFVKRSEPRRQAVAINRIIDNAIGFANLEARKRRIRIEKSIPPHTPEVWADPILIEQVLLNLFKNGLEAMEDSDTDQLNIHVMLRNQHIEVAVIDSGYGLADPERLFEPFFSTKTHGLGMGLNICRTIIESHQGRLWAEANPTGGTIFHFTLPCTIPSPITHQH
jgi:signal transduction histidine kinase